MNKEDQLQVLREAWHDVVVKPCRLAMWLMKIRGRHETVASSIIPHRR
jgi:hypothetical protein